MRKLVFLLLLVSAVLGWAEVIIPTGSAHGLCGYCNQENSSCPWSGCDCLGSCSLNDYALSSYINVGYTCVGEWVGTSGYCGESTCGLNTTGNFGATWTGYCYKNEENPDSVYCVQQGKFWVNDHCEDESCNDHTNDQTKCDMTWNTGYSTDATGEPGGGGYWQINLYECYYDSCAMSLNCQIKSHFPAGSLSCDDFNDGCQGGDCGRCIASIGSQCTIQCPNNVTINCACDGSCDHAKTLTACRCPQQSSSSGGSSSSGESSSSGGSSSSGEGSSSSMSSSSAQSSSSELPRSSSSPKDSSNGDWEYDYSQVLNEIEYNTRLTSNNTKQIASNTNEIATNTNIAAGYLSSIDKWASTINFNMQAESGQIINAIESGATQVANASNAVADSVGHSNEILEQINSSVGVLGDSVEIPDISEWLDSANSSIESLKNPETTFVRVDSLQSDTSRFKSKYSSMFLTNVYTRNGCYEFKIAKPSQNSVFGRFFSTDIVVNFGNLANTFDLCAILRGICRISGAILVLLISIKSYRSAFSSSDG